MGTQLSQTTDGDLVGLASCDAEEVRKTRLGVCSTPTGATIVMLR
jgi:hypothetical protein